MMGLDIETWFFDTFCGGVDFNLPGNGGPECFSFLSLKRRGLETFGYVLSNLVVFSLASQKCKVNASYLPKRPLKESFSKKIVLVIVCLVFGIELGYKLSTKQVIYLLNPCHVLTVTQVGEQFVSSYKRNNI